ncbi:hypothetical protein ACFV1U_05885 [Streptomyces microflavus]|uniref:hypothetical protein n=1 Tax=Streptomyces microflavus TaxID=1919 RepID=UPI00369DC485
MTTATPPQTEPTAPFLKLSPDASARMTAEELGTYARHVKLQRGTNLARALDGVDVPPAAGPRDLTGLNATMTTAQDNEAWYWSHPDWHAIREIHQQVGAQLARLNAQATITPQAAIDAAKITTLAASLISRHAARVRAHLDTGGRRDTPGGLAIHALARGAEDQAALAAGLGSILDLQRPYSLAAHARKLTKELRRVEPQNPAPAVGESDLDRPAPPIDLPDDPDLESTLATGARNDPELAEASQLLTALSELAAGARQAGHRLTIDVRLHGIVETLQLRGFEMIAAIARTVMRRYDDQGQSTSGRRNIAAMVHYYAETRLEIMRGSLDDGSVREFGHYEPEPPERYMDTLFDESRTAVQDLRAKHITPRDRTDAQIRFLLAQKEIAATGPNGDPDWGTHPIFPPINFVAGMKTDTPVETRIDLINALRSRVANNPFHRDAHFFTTVADRFAQEIAGPPELTPPALAADLSADQVRAVAAHVVEQGTVASPLALSATASLHLTHAQAERALAVLQTLRVVGPPNGLKPRETLTTTRDALPGQLELLEQRLPNLLELQQGAAAISAPEASEPPAVHPAGAGASESAAPAPASTDRERGRAPDAVPAALTPPMPPTAELPRRDPSVERRHPGNLTTPKDPQPDILTEQDLPGLLEGNEDRLRNVSETLKAGAEARAAAHPAPPEPTPPINQSATEAQRNAHQAQDVGVGVR